MYKKIIKIVMVVGAIVLGFYATYALAGNVSLGNIAANVTSSVSNIVKLVTAVSYMAGFGLAVAALFKFKQHKDNPQQVQLGTCIAMLLVGVSLVFLPSLLKSGGETIWGGSQEQGNAAGITKV